MNRLQEGPGLPPALPASLVAHIRRLRSRLTLRTVALALLVTGGLTCLVPVALIGYGMWQESQLTRSWAQQTATDRTVTEAPVAVPTGIRPPFATPEPQTPPPASPAATARPINAIFALRVPKIGYYAAVQEGLSTGVLATGPGHYPTTEMPGKPGLVAVAAHNTFWIPFGQLGPGDSIILEARYGKFTYKVTGTKVVNADDVSVLVPSSNPGLVLTTCWPLWAGNVAPQRLAILAQQT